MTNVQEEKAPTYSEMQIWYRKQNGITGNKKDALD